MPSTPAFSPKSEPVVVIRNLVKKYGDYTALDDLSLTLSKGQILGLIGPNGAGKTTTIKVLVGLSRPTSGTATISGVDCVNESKRIKQLVGYMPDKFGSYDNMRVREYLDFFGSAFQIPRSKRIGRIEEVMEMTGVTYMRDRYVDALSHGMAQKVGIARILLHDPEVLILDEPANGLDPQARIEMRDLLLQLARIGKTLLVTSHILPELSRICDQIAILTNGKLRACGTVKEIGRQVSQQRTVEVQLADEGSLSVAANIIKEIIPQEDVTESPAEAVIRFRTNRSEDALVQVLAALVKASIPVSQFRELQTDLEEAFMSFARSQKEVERAPSIAKAEA
ncbi:MAG: ABC transporter ATP-binding protein [Planctomycetaceae bacterium]|nr:ABC transporter ATP-binding protein [Planctomycetaceae bacterium]